MKTGSTADVAPGTFVAATFGASQFSKVQAAIERRAVAATTLAAALAKDPAAAAKQYGVATDSGPEFSITFDGVVGKGDSGTYDVTVPGLAKSVVIAVQTGPAIIGTDLRDAPATISFGQFTNQIDYQNAGASLNAEMKKEILSKIDSSKLTGRRVSVVGAFQLSDPKLWTITPVKLDLR